MFTPSAYIYFLGNVWKNEIFDIFKPEMYILLQKRTIFWKADILLKLHIIK